MKDALTTGSRAASFVSEYAHILTALGVFGFTAILFLWHPQPKPKRR